MTELARAKRRLKQLQKCLEDIRRLLFERGVEINAAGRDTNDNAEYQSLRRINTRWNRTL